MATDERVLNALEKIQEDITHVREDLASIKTTDLAQTASIEKLEKKVEVIVEERIPALQKDIAALKTKAAIAGVIGGAIISGGVGLFLWAVDWIAKLLGA